MILQKKSGDTDMIEGIKSAEKSREVRIRDGMAYMSPSRWGGCVYVGYFAAGIHWRVAWRVPARTKIGADLGDTRGCVLLCGVVGARATLRWADGDSTHGTSSGFSARPINPLKHQCANHFVGMAFASSDF